MFTSSPYNHQLLRRDDNGDESIWLYNPSFPLAIVFAILYQIPTLIQLYLSFFYHGGPRSSTGGPKCRHRYFVCVLIGSAMEVAGYAIRAVSCKKQSDIVRGPPHPQPQVLLDVTAAIKP
jgi:hypothetical protein